MATKKPSKKTATKAVDDNLPVDSQTGEVVEPRGARTENVTAAVQVKPTKATETKAERLMRLRAELADAEDDVSKDEAYDERKLPFAVPETVPGDGGKLHVPLVGRARHRWISAMLRLGHRDR